MSEPRAYTEEEVREKLLNHFRALSKYWATLDRPRSIQERCDGLVFSILSIFDGSSADLPAFDISPAPHPSDKQYYIDNDENWYEKGMIINECQMHEQWYD